MCLTIYLSQQSHGVSWYNISPFIGTWRHYHYIAGCFVPANQKHCLSLSDFHLLHTPDLPHLPGEPQLGDMFQQRYHYENIYNTLLISSGTK